MKNRTFGDGNILFYEEDFLEEYVDRSIKYILNKGPNICNTSFVVKNRCFVFKGGVVFVTDNDCYYSFHKDQLVDAI